MNDDRPQQSVGIVETRIARIPLPPEGLVLEAGGVLPELQVAYESYGTLSPARDNVVVVCHALSGDSHVAGLHTPEDKHPGWWDDMVGPGKGLDTTRFFVICANVLGGCRGTTGPSSRDPRTGLPYGSHFPAITVGDIVRVHRLLLKHLGIETVYAAVGGSFGGMQVLEWGIRHPDSVQRCICIATAASLSTQALSFDIVGREVIVSDPAWAGGDYYGTGRQPDDGLAAARMIGHITYLSPEIMTRKFGRRKRDLVPQERFSTRFEVESYLQYQGEKFVERFDSNSYLHITHAMDTYDLTEQHGDLKSAFKDAKARFLVVALSSDWLFPPEQSLEIATALVQSGKSVSYCLLKAPYGHDAFLVDVDQLARMIATFLTAARTDAAESPDRLNRPGTAGSNARNPSGAGGPPPVASRKDDALIADMIEPRARVLDLGCGDGDLLARLAATHGITGLGLDIDVESLINTVGKGMDVFQGDIDEGLGFIPDRSYDYVILSQTLQVVRKPRRVLQEMLRVARAGIVSIPNFANWMNRVHLAFTGRMPKSQAIPFEWYDTPNIHLATFRDFMELCRQDGIRVERIVPLGDAPVSRALVKTGLWNLGAERILVRITRA